MRFSFILAASFALAADAPNAAERAFAALTQKDYDQAIRLFREALTVEPNRVPWRKQLAYVLLKTGETEAARDQFAEAVALDPKDEQAALEYAYLCHETRRTREARLLFQKLSNSADAAIKAGAQQAFRNVDGPLEAAIERCRRALAVNANDYSAHSDLARAAESRNEPALAAAHYFAAWRVKPGDRDLLVDYGRVARQAGDAENANAALLVASRGGAPRAAEAARDLLPSRYPYASEFRRAIEMEPGNLELRRELGFLLLAMGKQAEGEAEFEVMLRMAPDDLLVLAQLGLLRLARNELDRAMPLLEKVLSGQDSDLARRVREALTAKQAPAAKPAPQPQPQPARTSAGSKDWKKLGDQAYAAGNLNDALRFYRSALEDSPGDQEANLKLGYTYNMLKQDRDALPFFDAARHGPDGKVTEEASRAYRNIRPGVARIRTTLWMLPVFSTRWHEMFSYGQIKSELKLGNLPFRPYASLRFVGDSQRAAGALGPGYLSESSFIGGIGIASRPWRGLTAWSEAGNAVRYRQRTDIGRMTPDYRGGISYSRFRGRGIHSETPGLFVENSNDAVYLSRFQWNTLIYTQNKIGYTMRPRAGMEWQLAWNANVTVDRKRQPWANFLDTGPGIRFRSKHMPPSMTWSVDMLRGTYLIREGNPRKPNYYDVRIGVWYAQTR